MKRMPLLHFVVPVLLTLSGCQRNGTAPQAAPRQQVIETTTVHRAETRGQLVLPARVAADPTRMVRVYPLISGRVLSLRILPGQQVRKGEQIGTLESSDAAQARADFEKARIEAARADLQLARARELLAHQVMAQRDFDDLRALDESDHADLQRARQQLRLLGCSENSTSDVVPIVAPISGVVLDVGTGAGELQRSLDNATAMATIADIRSVWVEGDLYPRDQAAVRTGQDAVITVNGYPGASFHGRVDNVSDAVDPVTLTLKVRVVLPNPGDRLKPGMYANMALAGPIHDTIQVPATAVIRSGNGMFVFVENAAGKYERRNVTLGDTHADRDEITSGLNDGDKVVTAGAELLRESEDK